MSDLILPDHAAGEYIDGLDYDIWVAKAFNAMLREIDPYLRCFWASPDSSFEHPGRWHIARLHPGGNPELTQYFVVQTPEGGYCVPQQMHLDRLIERDALDIKRSYEKMCKARNDRQAARLKRFEDKRREFRETLEERLDHVYGTRIAVTGGMKDRASGHTLLGADGKPLTLSQDRPREDGVTKAMLPDVTVEREHLMPGDRAQQLAREAAAAEIAEHTIEGDQAQTVLDNVAGMA